MNLSEIWIRVQRQFGDTSGAQITTEDITRWANDGQLDVVRRTECLEGRKETGAVSDENSYTLPEDVMFIKRVTLDGRRLDSTSQQELDYWSNDTDLTSPGTPSRYFLWGNTLSLFPVPSTGGSGNLDIFYVRTPAPLVDGTDIPEIPVYMHEDIVRFCLARAKELDDDMEAAEKLNLDYETRVREAMFEMKGQPVDSYPAVRVLPGDWG